MGVDRRTALGILGAAVAGGVVGVATVPDRRPPRPPAAFDPRIRWIGFTGTESGFSTSSTHQEAFVNEKDRYHYWTVSATASGQDQPPASGNHWTELTGRQRIRGVPTFWHPADRSTYEARNVRLRWEYAAGLWAVLTGPEMLSPTVDTAVQRAHAVRLGTAQPIRLPFRPPALPDGFELTSAYLRQDRRPRHLRFYASAEFAHPEGLVHVSVGHPDGVSSPRTVEGYPSRMIGNDLQDLVIAQAGDVIVTALLDVGAKNLVPGGALALFRTLARQATALV